MLTLISTLVVFGLLGLFLFRYMRGGGIKLSGTFWARLAWSLPTGALIAFLGLPTDLDKPVYIGLTVLLTILSYLSLIVSGHGDHQDMGRMLPGYSKDRTANEVLTFWLPRYNEQTPAWKRELIDFMGMTVIGTARGITQCLPIFYFYPMLAIAFTAAFSLSGLYYWLGYRTPLKFKGLGFGAEWGEGYTGLCLYIVLGYFAWLRFVS